MRTQRSLRALAAVAVVSLGFLFLFGAPAGASSTTTATPVQTGVVCSSATSSSSAVADNYLPLNRWSGALGTEHTRLPGGLFSGITNAPSTIDRTAIIGGLSSVSSAEWSLGTSAVTAASNFCFAHSIGTTIDTMAAGFGNALIDSPIVAVLVVAALFMILWRTMRGRERPLRSAMKVLVVAGVLAGVTAAATSSPATGNPSVFSPAWILDTTFNAISNVSAAPASALSHITINGSPVQAAIAKQDPLSCYWYNAELTKMYQSSYQAAGSNAYVVPESLDSLWEQSALPAYTSEQFGAQNNYGPLTYCHLLEDQSGVSPQQQMTIGLASGTLSGDPNLASFGTTQPSALMWNGAVTNNQEDESLVAWAACQSPNGSGFAPSEWNTLTGARVTSAWTQTPNTAAPTGANKPGRVVSGVDCGVFWKANAPATGGQCGDATCSPFNNAASAPWAGQILNPDYGVANWGTDAGAIATATNANQTSGSEINNFLSNFHGTSNSAAASTAFVFLLASTAIMAVFLVLALAVIIAKLSLVLWMVMLPVMLALSLLPSFASRLGQFLRHMLGLAIFATSMGLILSIIAVVTNLLSSVATAAFGAGTIFSLIFLAISPIAAVWLLHTFFKKVLKAPSPFSPTGAAAWGSSMGGFGAGATGGLLGADVFTHLDRGRRQAMATASSSARGIMGRPHATGRPGSGPGTMGAAAGAVTGAAMSGRRSSPTTTQLPTASAPTTDTTGTTAPTGGSTSSGPETSNPTPTTPTGSAETSSSRPASRSTGEMGARPGPARPWETEQAQANRHARAQETQETVVRAQRALHLATHPDVARDAATAALGRAKSRVQTVGKSAAARLRSADDSGNHWVRGSLATAASAARGTTRAVRVAAPRLPTYAKRATVAVAGVAAAGFGAPALAVVAASAGLLALRDRHRPGPARAAENLSAFRDLQASEQAKREELAAKEKADERARAREQEREAEAEEERRAEEKRDADERERESEQEREANEAKRQAAEARRRYERQESQERARRARERADERRRQIAEQQAAEEERRAAQERAWRTGSPVVTDPPSPPRFH